MSFKRWFKWWLRSWNRLILHGSKKNMSSWERKQARAKRRAYERKRHSMNYTVKKRKKARSSDHIFFEKFMTYMLASAIGIIMLPFGLIKRAKRSKNISVSIAKATAQRKATTATKASTQSSQKETKNEAKTEKKSVNKPVNYGAKAPSNYSTTREETVKNEEKKDVLLENVRIAPLKTVNKSDENKPKSAPKNVGDTWIRKRMTAEVNREEISVEINVGDIFDLALTEDKYSVILTRRNSLVATVSKNDTLPLATALKLGRSLYAIITYIGIKEGMVEIEFEGWQQIQ